MNTSRDVFFLEGRAKPEYHKSPLLTNTTPREGGELYFSDFSHLRGDSAKISPSKKEEKDEESLTRVFHLPPGVGKQGKGKKGGK